MFDAWVYFCFRIDGFEIFVTETKGLGIRVHSQIFWKK